MQGVTGLLYIDLLANAKAPESWRRCPAKSIRSSIRCSRISIACSSLPRPGRPRHVVVDRAARVLSDENIQAFSKTMENIQLSSATLPGAMRDAAVVVADLRATLADVRVAATGVRQLIETSGPTWRPPPSASARSPRTSPGPRQTWIDS